MKTIYRGCAVLVTGTALAGCVTANQTAGGSDTSCNYNTMAYVGAGAAGGALIGALLGGRDNRGVGVAVGTLLGAGIGKGVQSYLENRCKQLAEAQKKMQASTMETQQISVTGTDAPAQSGTSAKQQAPQPEQGVSVTMSSPSMFDVGSARPAPSATADFRTLAQAFKGTDRKVLIVGHTDNSGASEANQKLSEERAVAVAKIFEAEGIPTRSLYYKGAGETRPLSSNDTPDGRAKNRRVEVIELQSEDGVLAYESSLDSNPQFLAKAAPARSDASPAVIAAGPSAKAPDPTPTTRAEANKPATPATPSASAKPQLAKALNTGSPYDFGGVQVDASGVQMASIGPKQSPTSGFSLIGAARANTSDSALLNTSCIADEYRETAPVKSLQTGKEVKRATEDYLPMLYRTSWVQTLNKNLIGLTGVSVLKDGDVPVNPDTFAFRNSNPKENDKPDLASKGEARAFLGQEGILYRVFYDKSAWPLRCADIVFSRKAPYSVTYGQLYYDRGGNVYAAEFMPTNTRTGK